MEGRGCQTSPTPAPPRLWAGPFLPQAFLSAKPLGLGWKECVLESERRVVSGGESSEPTG